MLKKIALLLASTALVGVAWAGPSGVIQSNVAVCDPNAPNNCLAPSSGGGMISGLLLPGDSSFTRPSDTTPYAAGDLIANNTLAGSVVDPSFTIPASGAIIPRIRLRTSATTGWAATLNLRLWGVSPTYTNGDNGAYAVATGSASRIAQYSCTLEQFGDGASGTCVPTVGNAAFIRLPGTTVWWDLATTDARTPVSGQTFAITPEIVQ